MANGQAENNPPAPNTSDQSPYEVYQIPSSHPYYREQLEDDICPNSNEPVYLAIMRHTQQHAKINKPWWLWAIGILDIIVVLVVVISVDLTVAERGDEPEAPTSDQEARIFIFFIRLLSLLIQFLMGVTILCGLCSCHCMCALFIPLAVPLKSMESTTILCLHGWLYGAYFLICKKCFMFVYDIIKYTTESEDKIHNPLGVIIGNFVGIVIRLITVILVRRYMRTLPQTVSST